MSLLRFLGWLIFPGAMQTLEQRRRADAWLAVQERRLAEIHAALPAITAALEEQNRLLAELGA